MEVIMSIGTILLIVLGVVILYAILLFNSLVRKKQIVNASWAGIETQLQRRYDLIPNLVETVKGYAKHEQETLENVIKARNEYGRSITVAEKAEANGELSKALGRLFALSESYPDLKASENFRLLQEELVGTENKISYSRQAYNNAVMDYNIAIEVFPAVIVASMMGYKKQDLFKAVGENVTEAPKVSF
jgi:LemA protein